MISQHLRRVALNVRHYHVLRPHALTSTRPTFCKLSGPTSGMGRVLFARTISSNSTDNSNELIDFSQTPTNAADLSSGFLPPPPEITENSEVVLNSLGEPTLASLSLTGWTPTGLVQSLMENIHVTFELPWFASIMISTLVLRTLVFPITILQRKSMINMANHSPTLMKLQTAAVEAVRRGDRTLSKKLVNELNDYKERNDVKMSRAFAPLLLAPVFISVFWGVTAMTTLPVEALQTGGVLWFTDLCMKDPYYGLPILNGLLIHYVLSKGAEGMSPDSIPPQLKIINKMLPPVTALFCVFQPSAIVLYWMTSNIISLIFNELLKLQTLKTMFKIPDQVVHSKEDLELVNPFEQYKAMFSEKPDKQEGDFSRLLSSDLTEKEKFELYKRMIELQHEMKDREKVGALKFTQDKSKEWSAPKDLKERTDRD